MGIQNLDLDSKSFEMRDIICILSRDVFSLSYGKSQVQRRRNPPILLSHQNNPLIAVFLDDRRRAIRGSIVNNDKLKIRKRLAKHTFQRCLKEKFSVKN